MDFERCYCLSCGFGINDEFFVHIFSLLWWNLVSVIWQRIIVHFVVGVGAIAGSLDLLICLINPSIVRQSSCLSVHSQRTKWTFWMSFNKSFQQQKWILIRKLIKLLRWKNQKPKQTQKLAVRLMNYVHLFRLTNRVRKRNEMNIQADLSYKYVCVFVDDNCFGATEYLLPHATQNMCQKSILTKNK